MGGPIGLSRKRHSLREIRSGGGEPALARSRSWVPAVDLAAEDRGEVAIGRHVEEGAQFEACCHEVTHRTEGHVDGRFGRDIGVPDAAGP